MKKSNAPRVEPLPRLNVFGSQIVRMIAPNEPTWDFGVTTHLVHMIDRIPRPDGDPVCQHIFVRDAFTGTLRCKRCDKMEVG